MLFKFGITLDSGMGLRGRLGSRENIKMLRERGEGYESAFYMNNMYMDISILLNPVSVHV